MQYQSQQHYFRAPDKKWIKRREGFSPGYMFLITGNELKNITGQYASERNGTDE